MSILAGSFYHIFSFNTTATGELQQEFLAVIELDPDHPIFLGHFPGNPVVPGVCQVQMVKELLEKGMNQPLKLTESDNIKFLSLINPNATPRLEFRMTVKHLADKQISASATIVSGDTIYLKFKGKFEFGK